MVIYLVFLRGPRGRAISIKIASHQTAGEVGLRAKVGSIALGGLGKDLSVVGGSLFIMGEYAIFTFNEWAKSIASLKLFACASSSIEGQPIEMRPSGITPVASTMIRPGAPVAKAPRWALCQGPMWPSVAWYWHMGDTQTRFWNPVSLIFSGVKSALM